MNLPELFEEHRHSMILGLLGLFLLGVGILSALFIYQQTRTPAVEVLSVDEDINEVGQSPELVVDVEGAVMSPGLYKIEASARVQDALVAAGGLSLEADREWVSRNLNLAQKLPDGAKIYIPTVGEQASEEVIPAVGASGGSSSVLGAGNGAVNINTASLEELDGLWGVGEKRGQEIINNRPYASIDELHLKNILPSNVFERIKDEITI